MRIYCTAVLLLGLTACSEPSAPMFEAQKHLDQWVEINGQRIDVEVARTPAEQMRGLQHRTHLPENQGMWFIWDRPEHLGFWMKDTLIPLDILFFDENQKLLNIHHQVQPCKALLPYSCPSYKSDGLASYVLEINSGQAASRNLKPGDVATFVAPAQPSIVAETFAPEERVSADGPTNACVSLQQVETRDTPVDLMQYMSNCVRQEKWEQAVDLYHLSGVYAKFDTLRVADKTAHQAYEVLKLNFAQSTPEATVKEFQERLQSSTSADGYHQKLCVNVKEVGMPTYEPSYMINHGMSAFVGGPQHVENFNADQAWNDVLTSYLRCRV